MRILKDEATGRDLHPQPRELWDCVICDGAIVDGESLDIKDNEGQIYRGAQVYDVPCGGAGMALIVTKDDADKYGIPLIGYHPDFRNAARVGQVIIRDLICGGWINDVGAVVLRYTASKAIAALNGGEPCTSEKRRSLLRHDFKSGLITLHFISFAVKDVKGFGVIAWAENGHGDFEITLTPTFLKIILKTRPSRHYPELIELGARDEFVYKLAAIIVETTQNNKVGGAMAVKKIFSRLGINLDALNAVERRNQKNRLNAALDKLTKGNTLKRWIYTAPRNTTKIPKDSITPAIWVGALVRWWIN